MLKEMDEMKTVSALSILSNQKLKELYRNAINLNLEEEFIALLVEEMRNRGFNVGKTSMTESNERHTYVNYVNNQTKVTNV